MAKYRNIGGTHYTRDKNGNEVAVKNGDEIELSSEEYETVKFKFVPVHEVAPKQSSKPEPAPDTPKGGKAKGQKGGKSKE